MDRDDDPKPPEHTSLAEALGLPYQPSNVTPAPQMHLPANRSFRDLVQRRLALQDILGYPPLGTPQRKTVRRVKPLAQTKPSAPSATQAMPVTGIDARSLERHAERTADTVDKLYVLLAQGFARLAEDRADLRQRERFVSAVEWTFKVVGALAAVLAIVRFAIWLM